MVSKIAHCLSLLVLFLVSDIMAENLYVRPDSGSYGSEDGTDWSNAFNGFGDVVWGDGAGQLGAGDTLWIAGGMYAVRADINGSGEPGSPVTLKRATGNYAACTSAAGWVAGFDSQVRFPVGNKRINATASRHHIVIDGSVPEGIRLDVPMPTTRGGAGMDFVYHCDDWVIKYIHFVGPGGPEPMDFPARCGAVDWTPNTYPGISRGLLISHVKAEGFSTAFYTHSVVPAVIEYSEIFNNLSNTHHSNIWYIQGEASDSGVFRYNEVYNYLAEGVYHAGPAEGNRDGWKIYGNVFRNSQGTGRVFEVDLLKYGGGSVTNLQFYNNTMIDMWRGITCGSGQILTGICHNNIFYNTRTSWGQMTHDYNWSNDDAVAGEENGLADQPDPFADYAEKDFQLAEHSSARNAGTALDAEFAWDVDGKTRGADGSWDMGAFEYHTTGIDARFTKDDVPAAGVMRRDDPRVRDGRWYGISGAARPRPECTGVYLSVSEEGTVSRVIVLKP